VRRDAAAGIVGTRLFVPPAPSGELRFVLTL
jgi:hypothetical protein